MPPRIPSHPALWILTSPGLSAFSLAEQASTSFRKRDSTSEPFLTTPAVSANSRYAGYWLIGSIQPFPIRRPFSFVGSCVVLRIASAM